ncbi:hypothetical protein OG429_40245 (plasmid) [Streptomyces sp. NBC_00190]|uniref:hypothetical protein n=1 Tax=unclassified Streptomyces TaxID=2593676 RepID=UPI002E2CD9E1|nr:hypothetical protein [Streptomyces sp. NBC_00190]WSZ45803.1 hypothetical protein OG239_44370 [Streptomyces sp. NBC_00868]
MSANHRLGFGHDEHPLLGRRVRDIASGTEGELMAVTNENVSDNVLYERWVELAYIRGSDGIELSTAATNLKAAE